jgi:hypothetical protein
MFNFLFSIFKEEFALNNIQTVAVSVYHIIQLFDENYLKDKDSKNAAIDAVIQILNEHKNK